MMQGKTLHQVFLLPAFLHLVFLVDLLTARRHHYLPSPRCLRSPQVRRFLRSPQVHQFHPCHLSLPTQ